MAEERREDFLKKLMESQAEMTPQRLLSKLERARKRVAKIQFLDCWRQMYLDGFGLLREELESLDEKTWQDWDRFEATNIEATLQSLREAAQNLHGDLEMMDDLLKTYFLLKCYLSMILDFKYYTDEFVKLLENHNRNVRLKGKQASRRLQEIETMWSKPRRDELLKPDSKKLVRELRLQIEATQDEICELVGESGNTIQRLIADFNQNSKYIESDPDKVLTFARPHLFRFAQLLMQAVEIKTSTIDADSIRYVRKGAPPGEEDNPRYRPIELGRGGFGVVVVGIMKDVEDDKPIEREVAIKQMKGNKGIVAIHLYAREQLHKEAKIWQQLNHPNVVRLYGTCVKDGDFCLVMEKCEYSLHEAIHGSPKREIQPENLPRQLFLDYLTDIFTGLDFLHDQCKIIHRDIKPGNVLKSVDRSSHKTTLKLADFGLSNCIADHDGSKPDEYTIYDQEGTLRYMPPEAIKFPAKWVFRSDIYMVAMVMYEMLYGIKPYLEHGKNKEALSLAKIRGEKPILSSAGNDFDVHGREVCRDDDIITLMQACWDNDPTKRPNASQCLAIVESMKAV